MIATYTLYLLVLGISQACSKELPVVNTPNGEIQGDFSVSYEGETYMQFLGVPYAQPPIGKLRFEDPQELEPWMGTRIANQSTICLHVSHEPDFPSVGSEDCLYVNIFVPGNKIDSTKKLDVIVHIHSGGFVFGCGNCYAGAKYLMDRNVVYVNFNYRLGVFGFMSTADKNLPGNFGMKDQVMALKWVKNNIQNFGGNSNSITVTGLSAGGASTHYHYLSPLSRGLYNRGISVSGCALNPWTMQENPLEKARQIGKYVGCNQKDTQKLVKCMKSRNGAQLNDAMRTFRPWLMNPFSPLAPVVDKDSPNPFLPEHPYKLLVDGKVNDVPWIASVTTSEGLYPAADYALKDSYLNELNERWLELFPDVLDYKYTIPKEMQKRVSNEIKQFYLQGRPISKETYPEVIQMMGDRLFVADLELAARLQSKAVKSPVYFYEYDYTGEERDTYAYTYTYSQEKYGVCHGDDMMFVFSNTTVQPPRMTPNDEKMKNTFLELWTTYAKSDEISIKHWTPVSKKLGDLFNYLFIGPDQKMEMRTAKELGHRFFWESLLFQENSNLMKLKLKTEL